MSKRTMILWAAAMVVALAGCSPAGEPASTPGIEPTVLATAAMTEPAAYPNPPAGEAPPDTPVNSGAYPEPLASAEPAAGAYPPADAPAANQPWAPQSADSAFQRGVVFIEEKDVLTMESMPPQFQLALAGNLPSPCHELRVSLPTPDDDNKIDVEVYSVADPARICTQVLKPFQASIPLTGLEAGKYTVLVNGEAVGEIEVP